MIVMPSYIQRYNKVRSCMVSFNSLPLNGGNGFSVPSKRQGIGGSGGCPDCIILLSSQLGINRLNGNHRRSFIKKGRFEPHPFSPSIPFCVFASVFFRFQHSDFRFFFDLFPFWLLASASLFPFAPGGFFPYLFGMVVQCVQ